VTIRDVMLHHTVFRRLWHRRTVHPCTSRLGEAFYGTGEENQTLRFPAGYGYRLRRADRWRLNAMLMSHSTRTMDVYVQYRVRVEVSRRLTPVRAFWVRANGCGHAVSYAIHGGGAAGSTAYKTFSWKVPFSGRIVAAGGHLHGGARSIELSQPRCDGRTLVRNRPAYAPAADPLYKVRPLLHEPDPKNISWWQSATGWPIKKGERLKVTAVYDNTRPHTRVMGIEHIYVAPPLDPKAAAGCSPAPADAVELGAEFAHPRMTPPSVTLTLARLDADGVARATTSGTGNKRSVKGPIASVFVRDFTYGPQQLTVRRGATVRWHFADKTTHDVTLANGPVGFASPWLRAGGRYSHTFKQPGTYLLQCSLHAAYMSQVVKVTRERPRRPDADPRPR